MNTKQSFALAAILATSLLAAPALTPEASARAFIGIRVNAPPPPIRQEVIVTRPSSRHVWVAGHWDWRGRDYVWVPGVWVRPSHRGAAWVGPRWERHGRQSYFVRGHWR